METLLALVAGVLLIAFGMLLIHRLNAQHHARIAAHHFSDAFPALTRPPGHPTPTRASPKRRTGTWP
ncbi:hypothetical protein [Streptomyces sp. CB02261]|uniref:hypothetical protein n=1 Tax=Streptomyces sp. CB02261 TaxID=1703940 RepID=UPI00093B9C50|nr:hypothetical protein [Streptomyces sp. CB02261]OKJ69596.1 hypothetical protein AMK29_04085 [Streptomyces sp. CB02261]